MAIRKSAPKSTAKKAVRPEKKTTTKSKSTAAKETNRTRSGGGATSPKAAKAAASTKSRPAKAADAKTRVAKKPAASAAKASKATPTTTDIDKTTLRARGKAAAKKPAIPATRAPASPQSKRTRSKGAAKAAEISPPVASARKRSAPSGPPRTVAVTVGSGIVSKLGRKWNCFQCAASFYDLNRLEPLCPKCGADQRQRPKVTPSAPAHPPAPRKQPRPMAPLLDDEDDGTVRYDEEFDLGVRTDIDDAEQDLFPPGEVEEDDVFGADEE